MNFFKRFWKSEESAYRSVLEDGGKYPASTILPTQEETVTPPPLSTLRPDDITVLPAGSQVTYTTSSESSKELVLAQLRSNSVISKDTYRRRIRGSEGDIERNWNDRGEMMDR